MQDLAYMTTREIRQILFRIDTPEADTLRHELFDVVEQDRLMPVEFFHRAEAIVSEAYPIKRGDICVIREVGEEGHKEILRIEDWFWQSWVGAFSFLG